MIIYPRMRRLSLIRSGLALAIVAALATGCHQKQTAEGSMVRPGQPASVDNSWINAAKSCWPQLDSNGYSNDDIARNLIHHLSAAFPTYAALSPKGADADLSMPVTTVLAPDVTKLANSSTPVLTRGQAVQGVGPQGAIVQSTHGIAPPDALCSVQPGLPDGFSK